MLNVYLVDRHIIDRFSLMTQESINIGCCESMAGAKNLALGYIRTDIKNFDLNGLISVDKSSNYCKYVYDDGRVVVEISERPVFQTGDEIDTYIKELPTFSKK